MKQNTLVIFNDIYQRLHKELDKNEIPFNIDTHFIENSIFNSIKTPSNSTLNQLNNESGFNRFTEYCQGYNILKSYLEERIFHGNNEWYQTVAPDSQDKAFSNLRELYIDDNTPVAKKDIKIWAPNSLDPLPIMLAKKILSESAKLGLCESQLIPHAWFFVFDERSSVTKTLGFNTLTLIPCTYWDCLISILHIHLDATYISPPQNLLPNHMSLMNAKNTLSKLCITWPRMDQDVMVILHNHCSCYKANKIETHSNFSKQDKTSQSKLLKRQFQDSRTDLNIVINLDTPMNIVNEKDYHLLDKSPLLKLENKKEFPPMPELIPSLPSPIDNNLPPQQPTLKKKRYSKKVSNKYQKNKRRSKHSSNNDNNNDTDKIYINNNRHITCSNNSNLFKTNNNNENNSINEFIVENSSLNNHSLSDLDIDLDFPNNISPSVLGNCKYKVGQNIEIFNNDNSFDDTFHSISSASSDDSNSDIIIESPIKQLEPPPVIVSLQPPKASHMDKKRKFDQIQDLQTISSQDVFNVLTKNNFVLILESLSPNIGDIPTPSTLNLNELLDASTNSPPTIVLNGSVFRILKKL
ncbi:hypothetical protein DLAC_01661 [Tieghemostelium lacteum]|uniref:Uncharacterized protein n=1 Tax=Tieghemostelium lacteum TaxID=361077 RepID=A0A152A5Z2_TIELA|nr:hypothetical protein DLAC_01661 [Tieghemostelium lacteum]|eukprot:KYR01659.1 hypothetical protein DLAC_01661 [Tieghemostelium lacteum]